MDKKMTDDELKIVLHKVYSMPELVTDRIENILNSLPAKKYTPSIPSTLMYRWRKLMISSLAILLIIAAMATTPAIAANYMITQANKNEAYIIYQDHYYRVTGHQLDESKLGEQIFEVNRVGNWNMKRNGDSNHFIPSSPIYKVKGREGVIAVKSTMLRVFNSYIELERAETVEMVPKESIVEAKNDPEETLIALENVKKQIQMLYSFPEDFERVNLNHVSLKNDDFLTLYYRVPEADTEENGMIIQGFLYVFEYSEGEEVTGISKFAPGFIYEKINGTSKIRRLDPNFVEPESEETFIINDIKWSYYNDQLMRGELGNLYYEIQTQGLFTKKLLIELLANFKPDDQDKNGE